MKKTIYKEKPKEFVYKRDTDDEDEDFEKKEFTNVDEEVFEKETKVKKRYKKEDYSGIN
jgi:hypothetical protein